MTQEDKELLLKDLCARLPYGIIASVRGSDEEFQYFHIVGVKNGKVWVENDMLRVSDFDDVEVVKPYLRLMSSMTTEERQFLLKFGTVGMDENDKVFDVYPYGMERTMSVIDFLNAHHFDYRGLIEKGLAIEAPEGIYNLNKK